MKTPESNYYLLEVYRQSELRTHNYIIRQALGSVKLYKSSFISVIRMCYRFSQALQSSLVIGSYLGSVKLYI